MRTTKHMHIYFVLFAADIRPSLLVAKTNIIRSIIEPRMFALVIGNVPNVMLRITCIIYTRKRLMNV